MRRFLWIALGVGIGLSTLCGCKKTAAPTKVPAATQPATRGTAQGSGQTATQPGTTPGQNATTAPQTGQNPVGDRKAPFAIWWNSLTPAEREQFNKLPPDERSKAIRKILGK